MIGQPAALVVVGQPVCPLAKEGEHLRVIEPEQHITLHAGKQGEGGGAGGFFKREIIVARTVGMRAAGGVKNARLDPFPQGCLLIKGVPFDG